MNPIFAAMNNAAQTNPISRITNMMQQFNQFRSSFQGDPKETVEELVRSGKMSKEQFEQLSNMAKQFQQMQGVR